MSILIRDLEIGYASLAKSIAEDEDVFNRPRVSFLDPGAHLVVISAEDASVDSEA